MSLYVVSGDPAFVEMVKAGLKTSQGKAFTTPADLLNHLLGSNRSKFEVAFLELARTPDAARFIEFAKTSSLLRGVQLLVVGTEEQILALGAAVLGIVDGMLRTPCSATEIALATGHLRERCEKRLADPAV
ncbi:MAG TPA: hypothetical protein VK615_15890 [Candidatus Binatia bacterium]|nr:hypothetical protein [Candidatus Binatia bacterium]